VRFLLLLLLLLRGLLLRTKERSLEWLLRGRSTQEARLRRAKQTWFGRRPKKPPSSWRLGCARTEKTSSCGSLCSRFGTKEATPSRSLARASKEASNRRRLAGSCASKKAARRGRGSSKRIAGSRAR
jgi:hypothetical protein